MKRALKFIGNIALYVVIPLLAYGLGVRLGKEAAWDELIKVMRTTQSQQGPSA